MIQKITSKRLELPTIFLIENEDDFNKLPKGLPYIIGDSSELSFIRVYLEYQVLLKSCQKTNFSINWLKCLERLGYKNLRNYVLRSGGTFYNNGHGDKDNKEIINIDDFVEDQYVVNFEKLSELKVLPVWLEDLRSSVQANIINEVVFDPSAFNKQLGINVGSSAIKTNKRNLLILDVSGSMPNGVVKTITNLAKLMSKKFHADVIVTGGESYFFDYDKVQTINIVDEAARAGRNNEGQMFFNIVKEYRDYNTVISFGDDDNPGNYQNYGENKEEQCNFKCEILYSLHTKGNKTQNITGYSRWLRPTKQTHIVKDWITTIVN